MPIEATGGTISTFTAGSAIYTVHTFTSSGTFTVAAGSEGVIDYLIVGGGGRGFGGGGGGGGVLQGTFSAVAGNYAVTRGSGGVPLSWWDIANGGNSSIVGGAVNLVAIGGGCGGVFFDASAAGANDGASGGSGGGGGYDVDSPLYPGHGGSGTSGQGYKGGDSLRYSSASYASGGGGGAGGVGGDAYYANGRSNGGVGGPGVASSITGTTIYYAGGGGGNRDSGGYESLGGIGGGGAGGGNCTPGTNYLGGGGGGMNGSVTTNVGGHGVVILRYFTAEIPLARVREASLACGEMSAVMGDILSHSDSRVSLDAPLGAFATTIYSGEPPKSVRWSAGLACGEPSVFIAENPQTHVSLSLDDLLPFAPLLHGVRITTPVSPTDFASHHVWYEAGATVVDVFIPVYGMSDIALSALDPTTGDWREIMHRLLLRASAYYAALPDALRSPKGVVTMDDDYQVGTTLARRFTFELGVDFNETLVQIED